MGKKGSKSIWSSIEDSGILAVLFIAVMFVAVIGVIWVFFAGVKQCEILDGFGRCVSVSDFKFIPPEGWDVEKNTSDGFLINSVGPEDDSGSQPNFNIQEGHTTGSFEEVVEEGRIALESRGVEVLSVYDLDVGGKDGEQIYFRMYLQDKGYYVEGRQIYVNKGSGYYLIITFSSKDNSFSSNNWKFWEVLKSMHFE